MSERIYLSPPKVTEEEAHAGLWAIRSGWAASLTPEVDAFDTELAELCSRSHAVALLSGTAALNLGLLALGVRTGAVVITATITFAATANAITYVGARPTLVDSDYTCNINPRPLGIATQEQLAHGCRVAAIVPVDLLGKVADKVTFELRESTPRETSGKGRLVSNESRSIGSYGR